MHQAQGVLVAGLHGTHALLLDEYEEVVFFQEQKGNTNVASARVHYGIPDKAHK